VRRLGPAVAIVALAVTAGGCSLLGGTPDPRTELQREIGLHAAQWDAAAIDAYAFTLTRLCFCPPEASGPFRVTVEAGAVTRVTLAGEPLDPDRAGGIPLTIDAIFARLLALGPDATLSGTWHDDLGYPIDIAVDPIPNAIDDEYSIRIEDFTPAD